MLNKLKQLTDSMRRKGLLESIFYGAKIIIDKVLSIVKIFFLKLRGYDIEYTVLLRGENFFFQSTKHAINILSDSIIGKDTRISCGNKGKINIGTNVLIDNCTYVMAHELIEIGSDTKIAAFCFITDFNHKFDNKKITISNQGYETKAVKIGSNVWIGTHSVILPGVKIGDRAIIGAGSIVTHDIPANSVAVGNPAKVIRKI